MITDIYAILAVIIKDLKVQIGNSNLLKKSTIWFEILTEKWEIIKEIASILYYKYSITILLGYMYHLE